MQRTVALVQELISALRDERVTRALQLQPPVWRRSAWEKDDIIQRRVKHASGTVDSFQRMMDLARAFEGTKVALWKYRQSLNLFEVCHTTDSTEGVALTSNDVSGPSAIAAES